MRTRNSKKNINQTSITNNNSSKTSNVDNDFVTLLNDMCEEMLPNNDSEDVVLYGDFATLANNVCQDMFF